MIKERRKNAIENIEALYPVDSGFNETSKIGKKLLLMAILENDWRDLSDEILERYSDLCIQLDNYEQGKGVLWYRVNNFDI